MEVIYLSETSCGESMIRVVLDCNVSRPPIIRIRPLIIATGDTEHPKQFARGVLLLGVHVDSTVVSSRIWLFVLRGVRRRIVLRRFLGGLGMSPIISSNRRTSVSISFFNESRSCSSRARSFSMSAISSSIFWRRSALATSSLSEMTYRTTYSSCSSYISTGMTISCTR